MFHFDLSPASPSTPTLAEAELKTVLIADAARYLGTGAFGETWAFSRAGQDRVAKVLLNPATTSSRIQREIEGLTRVSSPFVVRLEDVFLLTLGVGQRLVLVFEFIDGGDVSSRVTAGNWPTPAEVEAFAVGCLRGLVALHEREVAHRDIKPENLGIRGGDWLQPVLLDLGLSRLLDSSTLTPYPAMVGTAPYMAPEVIEGRAARKGSDLWSLGVVLYLLAAHEHPFYRDPAEWLDADEAHDRLVAGFPPPPSSTPARLGAVIERFLSPQSYARGSAARALADLTP